MGRRKLKMKADETKIPGCKYPDCFHCTFHDCISNETHAGEVRKAEEAAGIYQTKGERVDERTTAAFA